MIEAPVSPEFQHTCQEKFHQVNSGKILKEKI
jgi:hypothetical protein